MKKLWRGLPDRKTNSLESIALKQTGVQYN